MHRVHDVVEPRAGVHQIKRLRVQALECFGGVGEHLAHVLRAADGGAVGRQEQLGVERGHRAQRHRPVPRVALDLLGVAGVRELPDEQVTDAQGAVRGHPCPGVVVGLATRVVQLEHSVAGVERVRRGVHLVGIAELAREQRLGQPELPLVDDTVVTIRELVTIEANRHRLVAHIADRRGSGLLGFGVEHVGAGHVVDMAVGVHSGAHGCCGPAPKGGERVRCEQLVRHVEHREAVARGEGDDVGEALDQGDVLGHFGHVTGTDVEQPAHLEPLGSIDDPCRPVEHFGHMTRLLTKLRITPWGYQVAVPGERRVNERHRAGGRAGRSLSSALVDPAPVLLSDAVSGETMPAELLAAFVEVVFESSRRPIAADDDAPASTHAH